MKHYSVIILIALVFVSCKTNELYINVTQPAPVTMPSGIRKIGIINRSIPTDETRLVDALDRALSLEGADLDRDGAWESIAGLTEELKANDRFTEVKLLNDIDFRASRIGILPPPLTARIVDSLCNVTGTDALFALERFDTDTDVSFSTPSGRMETPFGNIPIIGLQVSMETFIKTGWRIYAPSGLNILDEFSFVESLVFTGKGINPVAAVEALTGRKEAVKEVSRNAGHSYAMRILPFRLRVTRDYFVKGTNNFSIAKRKAQTGKWDEAGKLWELETGNQKMKIAGRACYNMAIINEINDSIDDAIGWAQKAWEDYKIRLALKYTRILENRKYNDDLLKIQEIK
ncbi:MAG: hypothetical protein A2Y71_14700 [Bacteroidetes bacterium RBG_13_42_15]|nr:MAG: hypothetical protein A2Y71_14700 [Bacteroidetes bacterium RBG_13_42_15]